MKKIILALCIALTTLSVWAQNGSPDCATATVVSVAGNLTADHTSSSYLWYSFTPATSGYYQVSSCGHTTTVDNQVTAYSGSCGSSTQVAYNDDGNCSSYSNAAKTYFYATAGTAYSIRWYRYSGDYTYTWEISPYVPSELTFKFSNVPAAVSSSATSYVINLYGLYSFTTKSITSLSDSIVFTESEIANVGGISAGTPLHYDVGAYNNSGELILSYSEYNGASRLDAAQTVTVSFAGFYPVNFDFHGVTISYVVRIEQNGNLAANLEAHNGITTAYLPNGSYTAIVQIGFNSYANIDFTVAGAATTVNYEEVSQVFNRTNLPSGLAADMIGGNIYDEYDYSVTYVDQATGVAARPLPKGKTYYYKFESEGMMAKTDSFTVSSTPVTVSFADYRTMAIKATLPAGWQLNSRKNPYVEQNGHYLLAIDFQLLLGDTYSDTLYLTNGSYTAHVDLYDPQGAPVALKQDFTVSSTGDVIMNISTTGLCKVTFALSGTPTTATDTSISVLDANNVYMCNLENGILYTYLPAGSYRYGVDLGSHIAENKGTFTASGGATTVTASYASYYKVSFDVKLPVGDTVRYINIYYPNGNWVAGLDFMAGSVEAYLPNGSYDAYINTDQSQKRVDFAVSGANKTVSYEEVDTRFAIANLPPDVLTLIYGTIYDRNNSPIANIDGSNLVVNGLVKGATYRYELGPGMPGGMLVGYASGTFTADTLVELSGYYRVIANLTLPANCIVMGGSILQNSNPVALLNFSATRNVDTLYMINGMYDLSVGVGDTITNTPYLGDKKFTVSSANTTVTINPVTEQAPAETSFLISDVPPGVRIRTYVYDEYNNNVYDFRGNSGSAYLTQGTYKYEVGVELNGNGIALPQVGKFTVSNGGGEKTVHISFADYYPVTFNYTLPVGEPQKDYYIGLFRQGSGNALTYLSLRSTSSSSTYYLPNGNYSWALENYKVWTNAQQPFTVNGAPLTLTYAMQPMHKVAFLPTGTNAKHMDYEVGVTNGAEQLIRHTAGTAADTLRLPAGTYSYVVEDFRLYGSSIEARPYIGTINVSGAQTVNIPIGDYHEVTCNLALASGSIAPQRDVQVLILQGTEPVAAMALSSSEPIYLPSGAYTFRIVESGYKANSKTITVPADTEVELELQNYNHYSVSIGVLDNNYQPLAGATVTIAGTSVTINAQGLAFFTGIAEGEVNYSVSKAGYQSQSGSMYIGPNATLQMVIELMPLHTVSFNVYNGATGTSYLSGATVALQDYGVLTTSSSAVSFSNVATGSYTYSVSKDGYEQQTGVVTVINGNVTKNVNLEPEKPYTIKLAVYDGATTNYLNGATVTIGGQTPQTVNSDTVTFTGLTAGDYTISVSKAGYFTQSRTVSLSPTDVGADRVGRAGINMQVKPANLTKYTLTFKVYDGNSSNLLSGASVAITGGETKTTTAAPLSFTAVDSGDVIAYAISKSGYVTTMNTQAMTAANATNDTVAVLIHLQAMPRYTIEFKVYDGNTSTYLTGASVELQGQATQTTGSAPLTFSNLQPGSYTYTVSKSGYTAQNGTLSVSSALDMVGRTLTQVINLAAIVNPEPPTAVAKNEIEVLVYPNPVKGTLYIKCDDAVAAGLWSIKLYTFNGALALGTQAYIQGQANINIGNLQPGMYLLYMSNGNKSIAQKVWVK